jgi:hypothetical protein
MGRGRARHSLTNNRRRAQMRGAAFRRKFVMSTAKKSATQKRLAKEEAERAGKMATQKAQRLAQEKSESPVVAERPGDNDLAGHAAAIRTFSKHIVEDVIEIGRHLTKAKAIVGHGNFGNWIDQEFGWSDRTALNFMHVYEMTLSNPKHVSDLDLPMSALYLLAAPSTPEEARTEIIERAEAGEQVSSAEVKETVAQAKAKVKDARRAEILGTYNMSRLAGTSLDKGVELDALCEMPEDERYALIDRATAGEKVSAKAVLAAKKSAAAKSAPKKRTTERATEAEDDKDSASHHASDALRSPGRIGNGGLMATVRPPDVAQIALSNGAAFVSDDNDQVNPHLLRAFIEQVGAAGAELFAHALFAELGIQLDTEARKAANAAQPRRKLTAAEIEFHEKRERRAAKLSADWLADHPGKTMDDAEVAGTCSDTDEGEAAWIEWFAQRYKGRDPLDAPEPAPVTGSVERLKAAAAALVESEPNGKSRAVNAEDSALSNFTARTLELVRLIKNREAARFAKTAVGVADIAMLGKFFTDLAQLKGDSDAAG